MQPEEKEIDKSVSEQLIEGENKEVLNQIERMAMLKSSIIKIIEDEDMTVGEWGYVVENISQIIGDNVSLLKLNTIIK